MTTAEPTTPMTTTAETTAPMTTAETTASMAAIRFTAPMTTTATTTSATATTTSATAATTSATAATSTDQSQDSGAFTKQSRCWQGTRPVRANFCCEFQTRLSCPLFWCKLDFPSSKTEVFRKISTLHTVHKF